MESLFLNVRAIGTLQSTVLISGESGTGKELIARAIHSLSPRREKPYVKVNCALLSNELSESLLYGHEKGAFTSADRRADGFIHAAQGGSLLLDDFDNLHRTVQPKLLRVLEERQFYRLGSNEPQQCDVRFIASSNKDLYLLIENRTIEPTHKLNLKSRLLRTNRRFS